MFLKSIFLRVTAESRVFQYITGKGPQHNPKLETFKKRKPKYNLYPREKLISGDQPLDKPGVEIRLGC